MSRLGLSLKSSTLTLVHNIDNTDAVIGVLLYLHPLTTVIIYKVRRGLTVLAQHSVKLYWIAAALHLRVTRSA
jgi:hypothetical protein